MGECDVSAEVINHWLHWEDPNLTLTKKKERNHPARITPTLVIHYGVANSMRSLVGAQRATGYWAHLTIDGYTAGPHGTKYEVFQSMPFNMKGSHAGKSSYKGRKSCNHFSIGVEIANPGPLIRCADGKLRTDTNAKKFFQGKGTPVWPEDEAIESLHQDGRRRIMPYGEWTHWATYTDQEIDILVEVGRALFKAYPTLQDVVGHDDISPGRKSDPGPAFPMDYLRKKVCA